MLTRLKYFASEKETIIIVQLLISSGCSFSDCDNTWPVHLSKMLNTDHVLLGLRSQGNGLISRKLIYAVHQALKTHQATDLLVGIMWSAPDRWECYKDASVQFKENTGGWSANPTSVVPHSRGSWIITSHNWPMPESSVWYKQYHDQTWSMVTTLEHVLRTQHYLDSVGVRYFMSQIASVVFDIKLISNHECLHLSEMIDWTRFISRTGMYDWANCVGGEHPSVNQHYQYTADIIMPWLLDRYQIVNS